MTKKTSSQTVRDEKTRSKKIGEQLEKLYRDVAAEPVPDEFLKLLEEADSGEEGAGNER